MIRPGDIYCGDPALGRVTHTYGVYLVLKEKDKNDRYPCYDLHNNWRGDVAEVYLKLCELIAFTS